MKYLLNLPLIPPSQLQNVGLEHIQHNKDDKSYTNPEYSTRINQQNQSNRQDMYMQWEPIL